MILGFQVLSSEKYKVFFHFLLQQWNIDMFEYMLMPCARAGISTRVSEVRVG